MPLLKDLLRNFYYSFTDGKVTSMVGSHAAKGKKWIVNKRYGRAYFKGYYEPSVTRFIDSLLKENFVFVDAGAHAGYFSLVAASKCSKGHVYSFEPDQFNYNYIESIKSINNLGNWTVENKGLGKQNSILKFQSGISSSTGRIVEDGDIEVEVISLDSYFSRSLTNRIDLIKIDVEGYGGEVIEGALQTILKYRPIILLENHLGSNEFEIAWSLLCPYYLFFDFASQIEIVSKPDKQIDFLLLKPRQHQ